MNRPRRFLLCWIAAPLLAACICGCVDAPNARKPIQKAFASTVQIVSVEPSGQATQVGSGFAVGGEFVAADLRSVDSASAVQVRLANESVLRPVNAVAARDKKLGLALLHVPSLKAPPIRLGAAPDARGIGERVYALSVIDENKPAVLSAQIHGMRFEGKTSIMTLTEPVSRAGRGGPILNARGEAIAIAARVAVSTNALQPLMERAWVQYPPSPQPPLPERFTRRARIGLPQGAKARIGKGSINHIAFSPDSSRIAAAGYDGVWIYDAHTGAEIDLLFGHMHEATMAAFSPDGKTIASCSWGETIRIWDAQTFTPLHTIQPDEAVIVTQIAYSPDSKTLAYNEFDDDDESRVQLLNLETFAPPRTLMRLSDGVRHLMYSPDGKTIAGASNDNAVRLWSADTGSLLETLKGHTEEIRGAAFSPDGKAIVSSENNKICIWGVQTGALLRTIENKDHTRNLSSIAFSPDGKTFVSGEGSVFGAELREWNAETGALARLLAKEADVLGGLHTAAYSPDGELIAAVNHAKEIVLWSAKTGKVARTIQGHHRFIDCAAYSPDGAVIAGALYESGVKLWSAETGAFLRQIPDSRGVTNFVSFSPDGTTIAALRSGKLFIYDIETGEELRSLGKDSNPIWSAAYSPGGQYIAAGSRKNTVQIWNAQTGALLDTLRGHGNPVRRAAYSPDGKTIAGVSESGEIRIWSAQTGAPLRIFSKDMPRVTAAAYSPDGKTIATCSKGTIQLWDVKTGALQKTFESIGAGNGATVISLAFSPDGKTIAGGGGVRGSYGILTQNDVRLWDVETGALLHTFLGHTYHVNAVEFSPDSGTLMSAGRGGTIFLWDVKNLSSRPFN